jgi:hypothetical protein
MRENGTTQLIAAAERHIAGRKYDLALDELASAQRLDPKNKYIGAIIDRVNNLRQNAVTDISTDRYLSVTVGSQFPGGVKGDALEQTIAAAEDMGQIKSLTYKAERQLNEGSIATAFESLMNAYLIDPNSPEVLACEEKILPAWNLANTNPDARSKLNDRPRLEVLKQQKEIERKEKERSMWRQASKPLSVMKNVDESIQTSGKSTLQPNAERIEKGLFSKLKLGKFLE